MRTENEIMELVLSFAKSDERIRAVGMNGSRVNPNVPKDQFQDYDIAYLVTDVDSFKAEPNWIDYFGERLFLQTPEDMSFFPPTLGARFSYLMLFMDGTRIDLMLIPIEEKEVYKTEDMLTVMLLDKDAEVKFKGKPSDEQYWVNRPTASFVADCWNEFWWLTTYVAKALWRKEFLYAVDHLNMTREMLLQMLEWKVGFETGFTLSIGKNRKYLNQHLSEEIWKQLVLTYEVQSTKAIWGSLNMMIILFEQVCGEVANYVGWTYPKEQSELVKSYLFKIRQTTIV